ncbi:MAG TPA: hypothetical protein VKB86_07700, partial [Pyrinomonadaceae bacterium]|nr:hypothetical protein [Pyrinomonadaceae bacterium]
MLKRIISRSFRVILFSLLCLTAAIMAQTPTPSPTPVNPTQQDATRPPGTERNQPVPEQARPTQNPTAPPGSQQPAPEAPPGTSITPQSGTPQTPNVITTPMPSDVVPSTQQETTPGVIQEPRAPNFPAVSPRPLPPLPDLTRLGVSSDQTLTLTLNEAIRRALENNNNIEVAREDVRLAETTLRAFEGVYDPTLNFNPQISNLVQAQQSTLGGSTGQSGTVAT